MVTRNDKMIKMFKRLLKIEETDKKVARLYEKPLKQAQLVNDKVIRINKLLGSKNVAYNISKSIGILQ